MNSWLRANALICDLMPTLLMGAKVVCFCGGLAASATQQPSRLLKRGLLVFSFCFFFVFFPQLHKTAVIIIITSCFKSLWNAWSAAVPIKKS